MSIILVINVIVHITVHVLCMSLRTIFAKQSRARAWEYSEWFSAKQSQRVSSRLLSKSSFFFVYFVWFVVDHWIAE